MHTPGSKIISKRAIILMSILWAAALLIWPLFILLNKTIESADQWTITIYNLTLSGAFKIGLSGFIDLTTLATFITGLVLSFTYAKNNILKVALTVATILATIVVFVTVQILGVFVLYEPLSRL